jgi:hypothetical protein
MGSAMRDLRSPVLIWIKAGLFVTAGVLGAVAILLERPRVRTALLLIITVWCFARAYYFAFHVIERYVDSEYRYSGLWSLLHYVMKRNPGRSEIRGTSRRTEG